MLLDEIEQVCTEFGGDIVCFARPTAPELARAGLLEQAAALRDGLRNFGVAEGSRVGLSLAPGPDLLTAIIAVWSLGSAFVPIDPNEVQPRRRTIVRDGQLSAVLAPRITDELAALDTLTVAVTNGQVTATSGCATAPSRDRVPDEAYVIFTSGSTGLPKGVSVGHSAIASYVHSARCLYSVPEQGIVIPSQLPPTFDAALTTLLLPLVTRNVAMPVADPSSATRALASLLRDVESPVLVKTTPSQLRILNHLLSDGDIAHLADQGATIIVGGEALDFADLTRFRQPSIAIFNEYGPTEATVGCSVYRVKGDDPPAGFVPIGAPFPGTTFSLDRATGDPQNEGELVISGPGVALGYVNAPGNGRFTHGGPERAYRSGDRVRLGPDGLYHFLGRGDDQVKVNGYRVELGEIDAALRVVCRGPAVATLTGGGIVAVAEEHADLDLNASASQLRALLPAHMQPSAILALPRLPLTVHGKIDRRSISQTIAVRARPHPADPLTEQVGQRWRTLLNLAEVRADTDFFAAGAHSITALTLTGQLAEDLGVDVPISLIFDHPTFADFVDAVRASTGDADSQENEQAEPVARDLHRTPSAVQLAIIGAEGWAADPAQFTVTAVARVTVPNWADLHSALSATLDRHETLRWRFRLDDHYQITVDAADAPGCTISVETVDLRTAGEAGQNITDRLTAERLRPIDLLSGAPLVRAMLFHTSRVDERDSGVVALIAHHVVVDEASIALLWSEVVARLAGDRPEPAPDRRYAHWAAGSARPTAMQRARDAAETLADQLIAGPIGRLDTTSIASTNSGAVPVLLPNELVAKVAESAHRLSLPPASLYTAAGAVALAQFMTDRRFPLFVPVTCRRTQADFTTVGCFVSNLPIPVEAVSPSDLTGDWVRRWHRSVLHATEYAIADVETLAARLRTALPGWVEMPRVSLVVETPFAAKTPMVSWASMPSPPGPPKHDLTLFLTVGVDQPVRGRVEWRPGSFDFLRAEVLTKSLTSALTALAGSGLSSGNAGPVVMPPASASGSASPRPATRTLHDRLVKDFAALASTVLGHEITMTTDLFTAGAQSVDLVRLCAAIRAQYSCRIDLVDIFDHPTLAELALLVQSRNPTINREDIL